jgi:hypothetical protein
MAKQGARAAEAEKSLLELRQRLAHRRIGKTEQDKIAAALKPFRGSTVQVTKLGDAPLSLILLTRAAIMLKRLALK